MATSVQSAVAAIPISSGLNLFLKFQILPNKALSLENIIFSKFVDHHYALLLKNNSITEAYAVLFKSIDKEKKKCL